MAMKKKGRVTARKRSVVMVNFSGVEAGRRSVKDGTYEAEIISAELEESSTGNPMIVVKWKLTSGKAKGVTIYDNISCVPAALWKMRGCLEALGIEAQEDDVPAKDYAEAMVGETATVTVTNETYEGEQRPKITGYGTADEGEEEAEEEESEEEESEEEEEDEPRVRRGAKKSKSKAKDEDEEEEEEEESEDDDDSEEEEEEEEEPAPKKKKGAKTRFKEGDRVKFDDGEGNIIKGTITNIENGEATVEDKSGDEYLEVPLSQMQPV
jgi:hypothetical protein